MRGKLLLGVLLLVFAAVYGCTPPKNYVSNSSLRKAGTNKTVKILVGKVTGSVTLASSRGITVHDPDGKLVYRGRQTVLKAENIGNRTKAAAYDGIITINGVSYRGIILFVRNSGDILAVNYVDMEDYLCSVVASEMSDSWPLEALKAQAIAARSYAYNHILLNSSNIYDLDATTKFQVYKGSSVEAENSNEAVKRTSGVVMISSGKPIVAFFHSTCGGTTIANQYVWKGENISYLADEKCSYCKDSPHYTWSDEISVSEFQELLHKKDSYAGKLKGITFKKHNGRVTECLITHSKGVVSLSGNDVRMMLGAKKIKSLYFSVSGSAGTMRISGHGYGHGVGMCQYGARGMALKGLDHVEILRKYYRGIEFLRL